MKSYSQAGQDRFAFAMNEGRLGTFLDVGAHDGFKNSNSAGLEEAGWTGLLVDIQTFPDWVRRTCEFIVADAVTADWHRIIDLYFNEAGTVDYLSLDVDEATNLALKRIITAPVKFRAITIEHDAYRLGRAPQRQQHEILTWAGYDLVCCDVRVGPGEWGTGGPFEDWWASTAVPEEIRNQWRCFNCLGEKIQCLESSS